MDTVLKKIRIGTTYSEPARQACEVSQVQTSWHVDGHEREDQRRGEVGLVDEGLGGVPRGPDERLDRCHAEQPEGDDRREAPKPDGQRAHGRAVRFPARKRR